jgi:hypothetical protein
VSASVSYTISPGGTSGVVALDPVGGNTWKGSTPLPGGTVPYTASATVVATDGAGHTSVASGSC